MQLQKQLNGMAERRFELRNNRNGTRVVTKDMVNYRAVKAQFQNRNLQYFTFHPKSQKPINAATCHVSQNAPAEDISYGLIDFGFDVISVK
jgi:hypothetical protein